MPKVIVGIDPGIYGGLVFIDPYQHLICGFRMPVKQFQKTTKTKSGKFKTQKMVDAVKLAEITSRFSISVGYIENVHATPQMGVVSAFSFGHSRGVLEGNLASQGASLAFVAPNKWKADLMVPADKEKAIKRAKTLLPGCDKLFDTGNKEYNSGLAEAAMICLYGLLLENFQLQKPLELINV